MKGIMQNAYDVKNQQNFDQIEADYKPALKKYNLKPPKPTKANIMRAQAQIDKRDGVHQKKGAFDLLQKSISRRPSSVNMHQTSNDNNGEKRDRSTSPKQKVGDFVNEIWH